MQGRFSARTLAGCVLLLLAIDQFRGWMARLPDRQELGPRAVELRFDPVRVRLDAGTPLRVAGAWKVSSDDPRVGGVSAVAVDSGALIALTDRGALIRFPQPAENTVRAPVRELPAGPGNPGFNILRDAEAILKDPRGRGWWVGFEFVHELWLFDGSIRRPLQRVHLRSLGMPNNRGIEGLASEGDDLLLFVENGRSVVRVGAKQRKLERVQGSGAISDVAEIGSGRLVAIERRVTPLGFANALVLLAKTRDGYSKTRRIGFRASAIDNSKRLRSTAQPAARAFG